MPVESTTPRKTQPLDLAVLIPTYNCAESIKEHVRTLNTWIGKLASEVVVVDSHSNDGTLEYLKEHLNHPLVRYISHPPGLYESWNHGIEHLTRRFTYIATTGDSISGDNIEELYTQAIDYDADITVSPPQIIFADGSRSSAQWPIHKYLAWRSISEAHILHPLDVLRWNIISLPGTLLGSSAGNLYRTRILQECSFSPEFGHAGDSGWALKQSRRQKWLVIPGVRSIFIDHRDGKRNRKSHREGRRNLISLANEILKSENSSEHHQILLLLQSYTDLLLSLENAGDILREIRQSWIPWYLRYAGWNGRIRMRKTKKMMKEMKERILSDRIITDPDPSESVRRAHKGEEAAPSP